MKTLKKVTHYPLGGLYGEYESVTIETLDGAILKRYEDYNDRGEEKADGFIDGYICASECDIELEYYSIDDGTDYSESGKEVEIILESTKTLEYVKPS